MQVHLNHIEFLNPKINVIVSIAANVLEAVMAAKAVVLAGETLGPWHGVPFTAKNSIDTVGALTQRGSPVFKGGPPKTDAAVISRIKRVGRILLARTNLREFSNWIEIDNLLFSRSHNL